MRRCRTCEGLLEDDQFMGDSPICRTCVERLRTEYDVEYAPPERRTPKEAITNLIVAIKEQAERDEDLGNVLPEDGLYGGPMAAWRYNWIESEPWRKLWGIMLSSVEQVKQSRTTVWRIKR